MNSVEIVEVGPRDGLQNEKVSFSTEQKLAFIERAIAGGVRRIEAASFVNPRLVPQMADAEAVAAGLTRHAGVIYIGLVLNKRGALRALEAGLDELGAVCAASDGFATRNQGQSSAESLQMCLEVVRLAQDQGRRAQITISTAFGCPFDGEVDPLRHNTRNTGLANVWAAVQAGAGVVDASLAGLGGCPFAPRATGNVPTEDVVYMLERSGIHTGLDLDSLIDSSRWLSGLMGRELPGMVSRAGNFPGELAGLQVTARSGSA
jgi:hydroxymethylglutaryl-CoA lyase